MQSEDSNDSQIEMIDRSAFEEDLEESKEREEREEREGREEAVPIQPLLPQPIEPVAKKEKSTSRSRSRTKRNPKQQLKAQKATGMLGLVPSYQHSTPDKELPKGIKKEVAKTLNEWFQSSLVTLSNVEMDFLKAANYSYENLIPALSALTQLALVNIDDQNYAEYIRQSLCFAQPRVQPDWIEEYICDCSQYESIFSQQNHPPYQGIKNNYQMRMQDGDYEAHLRTQQLVNTLERIDKELIQPVEFLMYQWLRDTQGRGLNMQAFIMDKLLDPLYEKYSREVFHQYIGLLKYGHFVSCYGLIHFIQNNHVPKSSISQSQLNALMTGGLSSSVPGKILFTTIVNGLFLFPWDYLARLRHGETLTRRWNYKYHNSLHLPDIQQSPHFVPLYPMSARLYMTIHDEEGQLLALKEEAQSYGMSAYKMLSLLENVNLASSVRDGEPYCGQRLKDFVVDTDSSQSDQPKAPEDALAKEAYTAMQEYLKQNQRQRREYCDIEELYDLDNFINLRYYADVFSRRYGNKDYIFRDWEKYVLRENDPKGPYFPHEASQTVSTTTTLGSKRTYRTRMELKM